MVPKDADVSSALMRCIKEQLGGDLPAVAALMFQDRAKVYPDAMARARLYPPNPWAKMQLVHLWAVVLPPGV